MKFRAGQTSVPLSHPGARPGFDLDAHKVFAMGLFGDANLWVTSNSMTDAFYLLKKAIDPHDVQAAFNKALAFLHVCSVGHEDVLRATQLSWTDMEDCLVSVCAEKLHADFIVTRDAKGFTQSRVDTISPQEILVKMEERGLLYSFA